jgi:RNA polymerase sigma-70 factor (ECF subfamily)
MRSGVAAAVQLSDGLDELDDLALVERARNRDGAAFRLIMQRHNRRLYRVARGVLGDDGEAEDVVQEAYLNAFTHLASFRGDARLSTWLTRITLNEALGRLRRRRPFVALNAIDTNFDPTEAQVIFLPRSSHDGGPEAAAARTEARRLLESAVDRLPDPFRVVFVMREIEEMSVEETAAHLGLLPETVRTRLHRARRLLRQTLVETFASTMVDAFPFDGARCARMTAAVLERLGVASPDRDEPARHAQD